MATLVLADQRPDLLAVRTAAHRMAADGMGLSEMRPFIVVGKTGVMTDTNDKPQWQKDHERNLAELERILGALDKFLGPEKLPTPEMGNKP